MKRYATHNLDEASFYALRGLKYTSKKIGVVSSCYSFEHTPHMEKCRKEFWGKGTKVSLHSWLAVRSGLKNEMRSRPLIQEYNKVKPGEPLKLVPGMPYYYIDPNGTVMREMWGTKNPVHQQRYDAGNVYITHADACGALKQYSKSN